MHNVTPKSAARAARRLRRDNKKLRLLLAVAFATIIVLISLLAWVVRSDLWPILVGSVHLCWDARKDVIELCLKMVGWLIERHG